MAHINISVTPKKVLACFLIFLVLVGILIGWLWLRTNEDKTHITNYEQVKAKSQLSKPKIQKDELENIKTGNGELESVENMPLPSPFNEDIHFTPYKSGSLVYQVDGYVEEELKLAKQIANESFDETLQNTVDWDSNYYKLVIQDAEPQPAYPSSLKLIIYSRRYAKLIEDGNAGLTDKDKLSIARQLSQDLACWRNLWSDGQRIRSAKQILHSVQKNSDELIIPLTFRINSTMLLVGAFSVEEALPQVIESIETLGDDTNWSVAGYTCDKILEALNTKKLNVEQQGIIDEYSAWKDKQETKIFEYETKELPSFKSPKRPFERATSLGASLDISQGKVILEMPTQYSYLALTQEKGYFDPTGYSEVQRKVVSFAKSYLETIQ